MIGPKQIPLPDNTQHSQETDFHTLARFKPTTPASEQPHTHALDNVTTGIGLRQSTGLSKKMGGIWNRYNLKSTGRIYTFGVLKCSEKFKVLDLP